MTDIYLRVGSTRWRVYKFVAIQSKEYLDQTQNWSNDYVTVYDYLAKLCGSRYGKRYIIVTMATKFLLL